MEAQTIADVIEEQFAHTVATKKFVGADDPELKKNWVLVDGLGRELTVLYICHRTGHFLASERTSNQKNINPLEYDKSGRFVGYSRVYDITTKKRI